MTTIDVTKPPKADHNTFDVAITDKSGKTSHRVTVPDVAYARLAGGRGDRAELVRRSFEFLLEREPKESILAEFELMVIARYFPDYPAEMERRLGLK